jgi:hypothetical protein
LLRAHVQQLGDRAFRLALSFHHAILDGWSLAAFTTELTQVYGAIVDGRVPEGRPLRVSHRDFVALERHALASEASQASGETASREPLQACCRAWRGLRTAGVHRPPPRPGGAPISERRVQSLAQELSVPPKSVLLART